MAEPAPARGMHTFPSTARTLLTAGGPLLAGAAETGGRVTLIQSTIPAGDETPLHRDAAMDESGRTAAR